MLRTLALALTMGVAAADYVVAGLFSDAT